MFKSFLIGIVLGIVAAAGALYAFPAVDLTREASIITVAPNGGTLETFHIDIPMDRVMAARSEPGPVPPGLTWPADPQLSPVNPEMFKIRNARDVVVGIGVRTAVRHGDENVIDWLLHVPARGSLFVSMEPLARDGGVRVGEITAGTREFASLQGGLDERWVANESVEEDAPIGRIELRAYYVGELEPLPASEIVQ